MKKQIILFCFLFSFLFSVLNLFAEKFQKLPINQISEYCIIKAPLEEGFCAGTLVKTPYRYVPIEDLSISDVVIDAQGKETEIIAITKRFVDKYNKIFIYDSVLCIGNDQQLYSNIYCEWIKARNLPESESFSDFTILYSITTESHTLCVTTYDIGAHNSAALLGAASVNLGYIAIINPVIAILGSATVALAVVIYNAQQKYAYAQQKYVQKYPEKQSSFDIPDTIILADRFYYLSRKKTLERLRNELLIIKNNLEKIHGLSLGCFTQQFLQGHSIDIFKDIWLPSIEKEKQLSEDKKLQLQELRENDLVLLEKQIEDVQLLLALHVNQVIANFYEAECVYNIFIPKINETIFTWNNSLLSHNDALQAYKYDLLREFLVYDIKRRVDELEAIINYYHDCRSLCIQKSTTIIKTLDDLTDKITEKRKWLSEEEHIVGENIAISEHYFAKHNISIENFKNEAQKDLDKQRKDREVQLLKEVESQLAVGVPGGPKKDDEDENKENLKIEIYEKNAPHIFRNEPGHFSIDTPENRKILIDVASDIKNFLGKCKYGNEWYAKILDNGKQVWVSVRNGFIRNGGLNNFPYNFNFEKGLYRLIK